MLVGGGYFIDRAWRALRAGSLHIDLPIALGLIAAYIGSIAGWMLGSERLMYFDFVSIFVFLMLRAVSANRGGGSQPAAAGAAAAGAGAVPLADGRRWPARKSMPG
jgi:hypothetical protein